MTKSITLKLLATGLVATLLSACSQSEDPTATKDKLLLTYQTLLSLDLDTAMADPAITFGQGDGFSSLYVGERGKDRYVFEISTLKDDETKCQIYVKLDEPDAMPDSRLGTYTVDLNKVQLGKPSAGVSGDGWAIGQVSFESGAIEAKGRLPLQRLGAKLGNASGDAGSNKSQWEGRLASLQKYCPGPK